MSTRPQVYLGSHPPFLLLFLFAIPPNLKCSRFQTSAISPRLPFLSWAPGTHPPLQNLTFSLLFFYFFIFCKHRSLTPPQLPKTMPPRPSLRSEVTPLHNLYYLPEVIWAYPQNISTVHTALCLALSLKCIFNIFPPQHRRLTSFFLMAL